MSIYFPWEIKSFEGKYSDLLDHLINIEFLQNARHCLSHSYYYYTGSTYHKAWHKVVELLKSILRPRSESY